MTRGRHWRAGWAAAALVPMIGGAIGAHAQQTEAVPEVYSSVPMTASEEDTLREQVEANWNMGWAEQCPPEQQKVFEVRVHLASDNTVTKVEPLGELADDRCSVLVRDSAIRAIMIASPLKVPPGKQVASMVLRFHPVDMAQKAPAPQ